MHIKPFIRRYRQDYIFKTITSSVASFAITILFALYNGFLGIIHLSVWYGSICVFYLLLVIIRGMILLTEKKNADRSEQRRIHYRYKTFLISSVMLLLLNLALIVPVSLMVAFEKPINMGLIPAIAMAAYTTYKITMASIHIKNVKHSNCDNILVVELRTINFIDALVSVLTLQNTLIMVNQASGSEKMLAVSAASSAVIYIAIMSMTIRLIIIGVKQSKKNF